jgi:hypothetical protein
MARYGFHQLYEFGGGGRRVGGGTGRFMNMPPPNVRDIGPPPDMRGVSPRQVLTEIDNGNFSRMSPEGAARMSNLGVPPRKRPSWLEEAEEDAVGR